LPERDYFQMETFGYRTRLFEALFLAKSQETKGLAIQKELAGWIAKRYTRLHPGQPKPRAVRFVAGLRRANLENVPSKRWQTTPLESFAKEDLYIISTHRIAP